VGFLALSEAADLLVIDDSPRAWPLKPISAAVVLLSQSQLRLYCLNRL
jgi:hypothetical protein